MGIRDWFGGKDGDAANDAVMRVIAANARDALKLAPVGGGPDEHQKQALMEQLLGRVWAIRTSSAPVAECREFLLTMAIEWAHYYVLLLGPPPIQDPMNMLGQPGITGQLRPRILDVIKVKDEVLGGEIYRVLGDNYSAEEAIAIAEVLLWRVGIWLQAANGLRIALGDRHQSKQWDWLKPVLHAECAIQEAIFRTNLGMPSALATESDTSGGIAFLDYSRMQEFVRQGHQFPDKAWREFFESEINEGILPLPNFPD